MAALAKQVLERKRVPQGGAGQRNAEGTQQANASALQRRGVKSQRIADAPTQPTMPVAVNSPKNQANWVSGNPMGITGVDVYPDSAMRTTMQRAHPGTMTRELLGAMGSPKTARAPGSIWDDPIYGQMANERGAEFAMKARDLDQQVNAGREYQRVKQESMADQFNTENMKRENARGQMQYQREAAAYGTPEQVSEAYGGGSYRTPEGEIVRPGGDRIDPRTGQAIDETGAYTGRRGQETVGVAPQTESQSAAAQFEHERVVAGIKAISEGLRAELGKDYQDDSSKQRIQGLQDQLEKLIGSTQTASPESPPMKGAKKAPDGNWYVKKNGKWNMVEQ